MKTTILLPFQGEYPKPSLTTQGVALGWKLVAPLGRPEPRRAHRPTGGNGQQPLTRRRDNQNVRLINGLKGQ